MTGSLNVATNVFQQALARPGEKAMLTKLHRRLKGSIAQLQSACGHPLQVRRTCTAIWLDAAELAGHLAADPFVREYEQTLSEISDGYHAGRFITPLQRELHRVIMSGAGADHATDFEAVWAATANFTMPEQDSVGMDAVLSTLGSLNVSFEHGSGSNARQNMSSYLRRMIYTLSM